MTDKAYIVTNEAQEREVLEKLEREGYVWVSGGEKPTEWSPSRWGNDGYFFFKFPYALVLNNGLSWTSYITEDNYDIVFDGRKEEQMSEKYVVSQEFMDELVEWRDNHELQTTFISGSDLFHFPYKIVGWLKDTNTLFDNRNRLIAIIRWVNGEDVFEVEKPKKWVVRSKERNEQGNHLYTYLIDSNGVKDFMTGWAKDIATKFDTKEEAENWANAHQEVIEVEE